MFETPILFLIFNRPDTTQRVFEMIKKLRPKQLFVAADGARSDRHGEREKCEVTRAIINQINWECELKLLFREENLGCGKAVSTAISWFFENVEMGIILEDDCLPHYDFFKFCEELLLRYKNNPRVMHIGSTNYQDGNKRGDGSYYFSTNTEIWGWATWKRTWDKYIFSLSSLSKKTIIDTVKSTPIGEDERKYWISIFLHMKDHPIDTWDYQYVFTIMRNNGLCILPNKNLVSNIGFQNGGTHTTSIDSKYANRQVFPIFPITHPSSIVLDEDADKYYFYNYLYIPILPLSIRIVLRLKKITNHYFCALQRILIKKNH